MTALRIVQILWLGWAVYWIVMGFRAKRTVHYGKGRVARWLGYPLVLILWIGAEMVPALGRRFAPERGLLSSLGILLTAAGLGLAIWARSILAGNWSSEIMLKQDHELIRTGPYAWLRHPIYSGKLLGILGTALVVANLRFSALFLFCVFSGLEKIGAEERLMLNAFPESYADYSKTTKRLIPGIW